MAERNIAVKERDITMSTLLVHLNGWLGTGVDPKEFTLDQLSLRAVFVFITMYLMIRIAGRRFMAQKNTWDVVLAFLVASMLARAINGSASFWSNLALGYVIAAMYRVVAWLACRFPRFGTVLKGRAIEIVVDGRVNLTALRRHHVSLHDLEEDLRLSGNVGKAEAVKLARLERSGEISVERTPQMIRLPVKDGVETIELRIQ